MPRISFWRCPSCSLEKPFGRVQLATWVSNRIHKNHVHPGKCGQQASRQANALPASQLTTHSASWILFRNTASPPSSDHLREARGRKRCTASHSGGSSGAVHRPRSPLVPPTQPSGWPNAALDGTQEALRLSVPLVNEPLSGSVFGLMHVRAKLDAR